MGVFDLKPVPGTTQAQINARGTAAGIKWAATRFPWIKVTSRSAKCEEFNTLDSKGGGPSYFGIGNPDLRPKPIVTGLDVKKQGELGTTRRATVKIIAFHDADVVKLQTCYFIPGMSVMVQWGWSVDVNGGNVTDVTIAGSDIEVSKKLRTRSEANPCFDGLQGIVTTFSFNLTEQNVWECTIEITAAAESILEVSAENMECSSDCARQDKEKKKPAKAHSGLWTFFYDLFDDYEKASASYRSYGTFGLYKIMAAGRDADGNEDTGLLEDMNVNDKDTEEPFITWATFEYLINKNIIGKGIGGKPDANPVGRLDTKNGGMMLKSTPYTESSDPRVCIVGGSKNASKIYKPSKGSAPALAYSETEIDLSKIMVNCMFLLGEVRAMEQSSDKSLSTLLKNILSKINVACGDLWSFGIVSHPSTNSDTPVVCIVDTNVTGDATPAAYAFPSKPNNSAIRSFSLNLKLAEGMKTQALYASKAAGSDTKCTGYGVAAFGSGGGTLSDINTAITKKTTKKKECDCVGANEKAQSLDLNAAFDILDDNGEGEVTDESCDTVRVLIKEAVDGKRSTQTPQECKGTPLPFELAISLDGIGGFGFGQVVTADRIPAAIRTNFIHQVTAVEHSVTAQDWVTTVNTIARLNK